MNKMKKEMTTNQKQLEISLAIKSLKQGNIDFIANKQPKILDKSKMAAPQKPFAIILGCSDSRVPVELIFNQGIGDLFVLRVAGNVVSLPILGSMEFAVTQFNTPLIVVMGHSKCGAIEACVDCFSSDTQPVTEGLKTIVESIQPVMSNVPDDESVDDIIKANIIQSTQQIMQSKLLKDRVENKKLQVIGAQFDLETGKVHFFD